MSLRSVLSSKPTVQVVSWDARCSRRSEGEHDVRGRYDYMASGSDKKGVVVYIDNIRKGSQGVDKRGVAVYFDNIRKGRQGVITR